MPKDLTIARAQNLLLSRRELLESGVTERRLRELVAQGELHRVRRGWYVRSARWNDLWPEGRMLLRVLAVHRDDRGAGAIFSHTSAAVLWGLPLYRVGTEKAHVTVPTPQRSRSAPDVMRHQAHLGEGEIVERHGILCTSVNRTVKKSALTYVVGGKLRVRGEVVLVVGEDRNAGEARAKGVVCCTTKCGVKLYLTKDRRSSWCAQAQQDRSTA